MALEILASIAKNGWRKTTSMLIRHRAFIIKKDPARPKAKYAFIRKKHTKFAAHVRHGSKDDIQVRESTINVYRLVATEDDGDDREVKIYVKCPLDGERGDQEGEKYIQLKELEHGKGQRVRLRLKNKDGEDKSRGEKSKKNSRRRRRDQHYEASRTEETSSSRSHRQRYRRIAEQELPPLTASRHAPRHISRDSRRRDNAASYDGLFRPKYPRSKAIPIYNCDQGNTPPRNDSGFSPSPYQQHSPKVPDVLRRHSRSEYSRPRSAISPQSHLRPGSQLTAANLNALNEGSTVRRVPSVEGMPPVRSSIAPQASDLGRELGVVQGQQEMCFIAANSN
ncbi:hypothetical protein CC78DRAFT_584589 [Lojkania enalia]|uniref:Uncharacterized protein n=1 Tax=Lojkania enalia TaxID=147567 RepID=A0A9P4N3E6_9PLEO|nr:hypothetical protein CC78DRAFT_584589 [Didymosphaeria enalia]